MSRSGICPRKTGARGVGKSTEMSGNKGLVQVYRLCIWSWVEKKTTQQDLGGSIIYVWSQPCSNRQVLWDAMWDMGYVSGLRSRDVTQWEVCETGWELQGMGWELCIRWASLRERQWTVLLWRQEFLDRWVVQRVMSWPWAVHDTKYSLHSSWGSNHHSHLVFFATLAIA